MSGPDAVLLLAVRLQDSVGGKRKFAVADDTVSIDPESYDDVVAGSVRHLERERTHHADLWDWCIAQGLSPPAHLRPS